MIPTPNHPAIILTPVLPQANSANVNENQPQKQLDPESKGDKGARKQGNSSGIPLSVGAIWHLLQPVEDLHCGCVCLVVWHTARGHMELPPPGHWLLVKTDTVIKLLTGPNPPWFVTETKIYLFV